MLTLDYILFLTTPVPIWQWHWVCQCLWSTWKEMSLWLEWEEPLVAKTIPRISSNHTKILHAIPWWVWTSKQGEKSWPNIHLHSPPSMSIPVLQNGWSSSDVLTKKMCEMCYFQRSWEKLPKWPTQFGEIFSPFFCLVEEILNPKSESQNKIPRKFWRLLS